jgi:hypothetical protein
MYKWSVPPGVDWFTWYNPFHNSLPFVWEIIKRVSVIITKITETIIVGYEISLYIEQNLLEPVNVKNVFVFALCKQNDLLNVRINKMLNLF